MDEKIRRTLRQYIADLGSLPNESAKTHRFFGLVSELFPGTPVALELAAGVEKLVTIDAKTGSGRRYMDVYYGTAIIEFENSLKASESIALEQLREQASGVLRKKGTSRPLVCIASDGLVWKTYAPRFPEGLKRPPKPEEIELEHLRTIALSDETTDEFWMWVTSLLFRPGRIEPTAERFRTDFGVTSLPFADAATALARAWKAVGSRPEPSLAFETWQKYLTVTYGSLGPDLEGLFIKHAYLVTVARLLVWAALSRGKTVKTLRETAREILSGDFFRSERIENLVENDFFQWVRLPEAEAILSPVWERALVQMQTYDLGHLRQDVLKGIYQELIDPKDRHDLGEYYTPDWLCERIVAELLPENGFVSVLDPACGSGSFLRATVAALLERNPSGTDGQRLKAILGSVMGIDIHPVAVTISKATYLLAVRALIHAARVPIQIPVYLADSLFLPSEVSQMLIGGTRSYEIRFGADKRVLLPEIVVKTPDLFDPAIAACADVAADHAKSRKESHATLSAYLKKQVPALFESVNEKESLEALWRFTEELADLIRRHKNSIWAFIVRNAYRPAMLRERFDLIVGNPPWLSYRYISDPDYQAEVKRRAVDEYRIAPRKQKLMTHMELATVFLCHAPTHFGKAGSRLGFVMPRSVLVGDQHENLRSRDYTAPVRITAYWDLLEVKPLFRAPSCVLFAKKETFNPKASFNLPALEWEGELPPSHGGRHAAHLPADLPWSEAEPFLTSRKAVGRLIHLGRRTAISTVAGAKKPALPSDYSKRFRQGATIVPRSFYFVRVKGFSPPADPDHLYWAETDPEQAKEAKAPYRTIVLSGQVEGRFLFQTILSKHLLPFALRELPTVVLPVLEEGGAFAVLTARELKEMGFREFGKWMDKAERSWDEKRGRKAARQSLYERLDYQKELTCQTLGSRHLVLYNAAGTNLAAAYVDRQSIPLRFVVEHKLYWSACESIEEGDYISSVLNSKVVNDTIKPFQTMGLLGERDIEKKALELPIPPFQPSNVLHARLARLGARARAEVGATIAKMPVTRSLAIMRSWVRSQVAGTLLEIDNVVGDLMPDLPRKPTA